MQSAAGFQMWKCELNIHCNLQHFAYATLMSGNEVHRKLTPFLFFLLLNAIADHFEQTHMNFILLRVQLR